MSICSWLSGKSDGEKLGNYHTVYNPDMSIPRSVSDLKFYSRVRFFGDVTFHNSVALVGFTKTGKSRFLTGLTGKRFHENTCGVSFYKWGKNGRKVLIADTEGTTYAMTEGNGGNLLRARDLLVTDIAVSGSNIVILFLGENFNMNVNKLNEVLELMKKYTKRYLFIYHLEDQSEHDLREACTVEGTEHFRIKYCVAGEDINTELNDLIQLTHHRNRTDLFSLNSILKSAYESGIYNNYLRPMPYSTNSF